MNREEEKNKPLQNEEMTTKATSDRTKDDDQHSYPGKLDQVEGEMNNGEIGGGLKKEE
ncbi:MAG TPA: hypothetical protein VGB71_08360 [Flavisolibacter sp.]|jgi:hypothetical protein